MSDFAVRYNDIDYLAMSEFEDKEKNEDNEVKNFIKTGEKIEVNKCGGSGLDGKQAILKIICTKKPVLQVVQFITPPIDRDSKNFLKAYNNKLINSLANIPFHILYHCPKSYLA